MRDARLEAGRLQRMRHARARLEIVVVCIEAVLRLLPVRLEIGVVVRVEVGEVAAVPAKHVIVVVVVGPVGSEAHLDHHVWVLEGLVGAEQTEVLSLV